MDDLLWDGSWNNGEDNGCKEVLLFLNDPSRCSSPPLPEIQTVARNLGLSEIETPALEMRPVELATMAPKSWPVEASPGGLLLEEPENNKAEGGFWDSFENQKTKTQNPITEKQPSSANNNHHFQHPSKIPSPSTSNNDETEPTDCDQIVSRMKELMYRAAVFRPVNLGIETVGKKRRRNVKTSKEPQTVAARKRREKISEKIRILQRLVPGGSKMDTASMLDEAASYLKFLRAQIKALEGIGYKLGSIDGLSNCTSFNPTIFPSNASFHL